MTISKPSNVGVRFRQSEDGSLAPVTVAMWTGPDSGTGYDRTVDAAQKLSQSRYLILIARRFFASPGAPPDWVVDVVLAPKGQAPPVVTQAWPGASIVAI